VPRDAEAWLAARGVRRERIVADPLPSSDAGGVGTGGGPQAPSDPSRAGKPTPVGVPGPEVSARDAARVAQQAAADAAVRAGDAAALPDPAARSLADDIAAAVAFVRRSTSAAPQSEGRIREKLEARGSAPAVVDGALERARAQRLVDDAAMAAAFVEERRAKGHAVARIRTDLRGRGFTDAVITAALADAEREDPEAAAFAVARDRAAGLTGLTAETAFRRVVGHLARRGYPEGLARKVAREAVFASREQERAAGH
jgi:regulatory protein